MSPVEGFVRLDSHAVLSITGTAARDFLSRQLTCDVATLAPGHPLFGAWLTPKGRALSLMHLLDGGDGAIHMLVPDELADDVVKRLTMFVLRDDVQLARDPARAVLGLSGHDLLGAVPDAMDATALDSTTIARVHDGEPPLALALVDLAKLDALTESLTSSGHSRLSESTWELLNIRAGLPWVLEATRDAFVPQMLNLDRLGAVSFSKGCYPGQEIVARTQHLGRIKRRTFIGHCEQHSPLARPGDTLMAEGGNDLTGRVVRSAAHEGGQHVLAVLPLDAMARTDTFCLNDPQGPRFHFIAPACLDDTQNTGSSLDT